MDKQSLEQEAETIRAKYMPNGAVNLKGKGLGDGKPQYKYEKQKMIEMLCEFATSSSTVKNLEREVDRLKALAFKEFESKISLWGLTRAQYDREVEVFKERNNL